MKIPVAPFLVPPASAVDHNGWRLETDGGDVPLPAEIDNWDYQTRLDLAAALSVDRAQVIATCELHESSRITVVVNAHSSLTRSEQCVLTADVPSQDSFDLPLRVSLPGAELGGRLTLKTLLVVSDPVPESELAPNLPCSILWRVQHTTLLQGVGSQFPTDSIGFSKFLHLDNRAGWQLKIDLSDLEAQFLSVARLTLNSDLETMRIAGASSDSSGQLRRTLAWDVARQMVYMALLDDDILSLEVDPDATSVGGILRNLIETIWPRESPQTVRHWSREDPSRIETRLQALYGLVNH